MTNKKKPTKKVAAPKNAVKKATPKKAVAKKVAPKKAVVKKAAVKKVVSKKGVAKKITKKATTPKKVIAKPVNSTLRVADPDPVKKKVVAKKTVKSAASAAAMTELSEELVEKAANTGKPIMASGDGLHTAPVTDPVQAFDKKAFNKATAKGDPHSKLHLSKAKNTIKPSGKKPLW